MRHSSELHPAEKEAASGHEEASQQVPKSVPTDGTGTNEELRECLCAGGGTGRSPHGALPLEESHQSDTCDPTANIKGVAWTLINESKC
jgi:hypothetical protein